MKLKNLAVLTIVTCVTAGHVSVNTPVYAEGTMSTITSALYGAGSKTKELAGKAANATYTATAAAANKVKETTQKAGKKVVGGVKYVVYAPHRTVIRGVSTAGQIVARMLPARVGDHLYSHIEDTKQKLIEEYGG